MITSGAAHSDVKTFEDALRSRVSGLVVAVDGKTVRGSGDGHVLPIHMVSVFATDLGIVLGQEKVARKSNDITAVPELLNAPVIKDYLVSIDAMGCQTEMAETIVSKDADCLPVARGNQPTLLTNLQDWFALNQRDAAHCFEHIEESHGRLMVQRSWGPSNTSEVDTARWPLCKMLATVGSWHMVGGKPSDLERWYCFSSRLKKIIVNALRLEAATIALGQLNLAKKRQLADWEDTFRMVILGSKPIHGN